MATKKANNLSIEKGVDTLIGTAKNIHDGALDLSDNLVEGSLATGAKWQKIMAKALTEGTVLFGKQQDFAIDTLEELKGQYLNGRKRFQKLLNFDRPAKVKGTKKVVKAAKSTAKKVASKAKVANAKSDVAADNLKNIEGIGPKIAGLLNEAGITTFAQLSKTNIKDLKAILETAGPRYKMHDPKTWRIQAKQLIK